MENTGDFWWVVVIGTFLGALLAPIIGYFRRPRNGSSIVQNAAIIDSRVAYDIVKELKRLVDCIERIETQMQETADAEAVARKIAAAVEADRIKRGVER